MDNPSKTPQRRNALYLSGLRWCFVLTALLLLAACRKDAPAQTPSAGVTAAPPTPISTVRVTVSPWPTASPTIAPATAAPTMPADVVARQMKVFQSLWEAVRDTYVYPDFNGVDWDAVYSRYKAQIEAGLENEGFYAAMREMIDELGDEHSAYYSPQEVIEEDALLSGQLDYVGIGIYVTTLVDKGYAVLLQVFPGSPGERAGLRSHDRILAVDGLPVIDQAGWENLDRIEGLPGIEVRLLVQTPGQEAREVLVTRERIQAQHPVEAHRIPGTNVDYVLIPTFWDETIAARVRQALDELMAVSELDGLILDMRINGGGLVSVLEDTLSLFVEGDLGAFESRAEERPLRIHADPVGDSLDIPLVVLIGRETASFGEIFSGLLHETGRTRLVGRTTDGNVEILWPVDFEDGSRAWIASETFRPPSGADWEDTGIVPDVEIPMDWDEFTFETDTQLQAAVDLLLSGVPR